jgi:hypothetical protein
MLRRAAPGYLSSDDLVQHLRATPTLIDRLLSRFLAEGLISRNDRGEVRFDCATPALADLCEALAAASENRPIALRDAIISMPSEKLKDFSEAFRFKEQKDE